MKYDATIFGQTIKWGPVVQRFRWSRFKKYYGRYRYYWGRSSSFVITDSTHLIEKKEWMWDRN